MRRTWMLVVLVACKGKSEPKNELKAGSNAGSGSGSATVSAAKPIEPPKGTAPKLEWKDPDGELLIATADGKTLTGPCGMTGTLSPTEVAMGTQPAQNWNTVLRDGKNYSFPKLDWVIKVSPTGEVVLDQHGTKKPLGNVTGLDSDEAAAWFGAFVVAAPMVQHRFEWASADGALKLVITGAADFRAWEIGDGKTKLASRQREDPAPLLAGDKPAWTPTAIDVAIMESKTYIVSIKRTDDATKAAFPAEQFQVTEAIDGTLTMQSMGNVKSPPIKLGTLVGRAQCRAHDQAIPALLWTLFASKAGHAKVFGT